MKRNDKPVPNYDGYIRVTALFKADQKERLLEMVKEDNRTLSNFVINLVEQEYKRRHAQK